MATCEPTTPLPKPSLFAVAEPFSMLEGDVTIF
jgi:hypothetical protein